MAKFIATAATDMLWVDFWPLTNSDVTSKQPDSWTVYDSYYGVIHLVVGTGFTYLGDYPLTGTVTHYLGDGFGIGEVAIPVADLLDASWTWTLDDDVALLLEALGGDDTIEGSAYADFLTGVGGSDTILAGGGDDMVLGWDGNDTIDGGTGTDVLDGGPGFDVLIGGAGPDYFNFADPGSGFDTVKDFKRYEMDKIWLELDAFPRLGVAGPLAKKSFDPGNRKADDKNDFVVYHKKAGSLYYDADGSGKGKAVLIAKFEGAPNLKASDFDII